MRVKTAFVAPLVLSSFICSPSQAEEATPTQFSLGFKLWNASWQSYVPAPYAGVTASGAPAMGESVNLVEGNKRTNVLPTFAVRHGRYFASASYGRFSSDFPVSTSPVVTPGGVNVITTRNDHFERREADISIGYFVTPEVGLSIGYKDATEDRSTALGIAPQDAPLLHTKAKALLFGAIGNFQVQGALRLYTQLAYGPARLELRFVDPSLASYDTNGRYLIGEVGLSYPLFTGNSGISAATVAVGYRSQTVKTASHGLIFHETRDLRDVREGLVVSLNIVI
jgi:hypothetical protein